MRLKDRTHRHRRIKQHIDAALMRRKVKWRKSRSKSKGVCINNTFPQHNMTKEISSSIRQSNSLLVMPLIEYSTIWDNVSSVNPSIFLQGIPTLKAIEFIVSLQNKVIYAPSDLKAQAEMIAQMMTVFGGNEVSKIKNYVVAMTRRGQAPVLMDNYSCLHFYLLALQNYNSTERELNVEDVSNIYKAYLYCSHVWLEQQQRNIDGLNLTELSILIDLPVVEFKLYKDFKAQLYKATRFFSFCKQNPHFGQFADWFIEDKGVSTPSEYLGRIFNLFSHTAKSPTPVSLIVRQEQTADVEFFDQYAINTDDCKTLWDTKDINYLRGHFLLKNVEAETGNLKLTILNTALLVDKLYQGMMFDLSDSVLKRGGGNYKGKPFKNKGDFNGFVGDEFSEYQIFYDAMEMAYPQNKVLKLSGRFLNDNGVNGELDYVLLDGERLYLFEYKDVTIKDEIKHSSDLALIKETLLDRVCKYEKKRKKGVGQLLVNVNRIFNDHILDGFGVETSKVKEVFLIVITTDTAFNAIGVNALVTEEFNRIKSNLDYSVPVEIVEPVILDFESLYNMIIPLREKLFDLGKLIHRYLKKTNQKGSIGMIPFYGFLKDYNRIPLLKEKDVPILFGGFLDMIKKEMTQGEKGNA